MKKELLLTDRTINKYIEFLREQEKSNSTITSYFRELHSLLFFLNDKPVTKSILIQYKEMISSNYAPSSCNVTISAVNGLLKYVGRYDLLLNPIKIQKKVFEDVDREITKKEYDKLVRTANIQGQEKLSLILQTICSTGIRISELKYITVEAVKEGKAAISCKNKNRVVFLPAPLCTLLKKYVVNQNIISGTIFITKNGKPLDRSNIYHSMQRLCSISGVKASKVFPHNFRHLFAKTYYNQNKDISKLSDLLGHSSINTTRIYMRESGAVHARQIAALGLVHDTTQ